jgi:tRNA modification GTPase
MNKTITAIATSNGVGAITIIRISGTESLNIAEKITNKNNDFFKPRYAHYLSFFNNKNQLIDKGILIYFKAPFSFTGEDVIEFQIHGGVGVSQALIETILNTTSNVRLAEAGEFTKRAFLNGKIDYSQVESIGELINTKSKEAVIQLGKQLKGDLADLVVEIREKLIEILAFTEVNIDYAEEDLPSDLTAQIKNNLNNIKLQLETLLWNSKKRFTLLEGFKIAIIGRPNVGKSSLLNTLLNYNRAIVSDVAGTTRDTVEEYFRLGTHLVKIIDTAGIRDNSEDKIENIGIEKSIQVVEEADIILALFDSSQKITKNDFKILNTLSEINKPKIFILNKSDLEQKIELEEIKKFNKDLLFISANSSNISELEKTLISTMDKNSVPEDSMILTSSRQENIVKNSLEHIEKAIIELDDELEIFAISINSAIEEISNISRPYYYEEMLNSMFGNFCLGK